MATRSPERAGRSRISGPERRDRILQAAVACFASRGFSGTTTREVAERAGITEAGLYRHFESKEVLYAAIIDAKMQAPDLLADLAGPAERGDDRALLAGLAQAILERGRADPDFVRILFFSALEGHELADPFFEARTRRLRDFLARYIARRVDEGAFRDVDPLLAASAFIGMVVDHVNVAVVFGREELRRRSPHELAEGLVDLFLSGVQRGR
jgi:AcrR family transcriptional regulator